MIVIALYVTKSDIYFHKKVISNIKNYHYLNIDSRYFDNFNELKIYITERINDLNLIVLDTKMGDVDGIDFARILRNKGYIGDFIFFSNNKEEVFRTFDVSAIYYFYRDDLDIEKLESVYLKSISKKIVKNEDRFYIKIRNDRYSFDYQDIVYMEKDLRKVLIHLNNNLETSFYGNFNTISLYLLNFGFFQVHRSFIINRRYITFMDKYIIKLKGDIIIPVGPTYRKKIDEFFPFPK
jgi:two-component system LytT family response regulator